MAAKLKWGILGVVLTILRFGLGFGALLINFPAILRGQAGPRINFFVLVQIFCARPKIYLRIVALTNNLCQTVILDVRHDEKLRFS